MSPWVACAAARVRCGSRALRLACAVCCGYPPIRLFIYRSNVVLRKIDLWDVGHPQPLSMRTATGLFLAKNATWLVSYRPLALVFASVAYARIADEKSLGTKLVAH